MIGLNVLPFYNPSKLTSETSREQNVSKRKSGESALCGPEAQLKYTLKCQSFCFMYSRGVPYLDESD